MKTFSHTFAFITCLAMLTIFTGCATPTPLTRAAMDGDINAVRTLIKNGADVNEKSLLDNWTPLFFAANSGNSNAVRILIDNGADLNARVTGGWTPLSHAAYCGYAEIVRMLIDSGANLSLGPSGPPWKLAQERGYTTIVRMLKEAEKERYITGKKPAAAKKVAPATRPVMTVAVEKKSPALAVLDPTIQRLNASQYWAVIIGISKYKYSGQKGLANLIFADDDAKAFSRVLGNLGWSESHIKLLVNEKATQRNIMIALESWLTKAGPNDQIVLFWAGHGFHDPEDPEKVYFACHDTDISIPATGYRMDRVRTILEERKSRNVILLADTCHAGKLITRGDRGLSIIPNIDRMRREQKTPKGWIFMVGADTDRQAIEHTSWSNGAFTHCLVKALSGKADGYESVSAKDGIVTMGELRAYLNSAMPDETQRVLGVAKRPVITTSTGNPDIWNITLQITR